MASQTTDIILIAPAAYGHISPLLQLAEIIALKNISVTLITTLSYIPVIKERYSFNKTVNGKLKLYGIDDGSHWKDILNEFSILNMMPPLRTLLKENFMKIRHIILDFFCAQMIPLVRNFGLKYSLFWPSNVSFFANFITDSTQIPLIRNVRNAIVDELHDFEYILVNSFLEIESDPDAIYHLNRPHIFKNGLRYIGPISCYILNYDWKCDVLKNEQTLRIQNWMDQQESRTTIYISMGSSGALTRDQILQMYNALVESNCPFIWSLSAEQQEHLKGINRNPINGLIISWTPQSAILAHKCIKVFLSHCGWNSILESISQGVPMIAWPLFAEQHLNASILLKAGIAKLVNGTKKIGDDYGRLVPSQEILETLLSEHDYEHVSKFREICRLNVADGGVLDQLLDTF